jgi:hypothetical protein
VPKIDKVSGCNFSELYSPKTPQSEIIDFILADLESAAAKLPKQSELTGDETGRVTSGAAMHYGQELLCTRVPGQNIMRRTMQPNTWQLQLMLPKKCWYP